MYTVLRIIEIRSFCNMIDKIIINGILLYDLIRLKTDNFILIILLYEGTSKSGFTLGWTLLSNKFIDDVSLSLRNATTGWPLLTSIFSLSYSIISNSLGNKAYQLFKKYRYTRTYIEINTNLLNTIFSSKYNKIIKLYLKCITVFV